MRLRTGWTGPLVPGETHVARAQPHVVKAYIAKGYADPIGGNTREGQIASLASAASLLGVEVLTTDEEVVAACREHGAKWSSPPPRRRAKSSEPAGE